MGFGISENVLAKDLRLFKLLPLGRVCTLEVFDKCLADIGESILGRHPKERCEHGKLRNLVPCREPGQRSTVSSQTHTKGRTDLPRSVDHLQQDHKILSTVIENNPRARHVGENISEFGGGKREDSGVNPKRGVSAHNLHVSILKVKRVVMSVRMFATVLSDIIA